jgi:hypothetical protein
MISKRAWAYYLLLRFGINTGDGLEARRRALP